MATHEELAMLKSNWRGDPCWDLEQTEGFEEHYQELLDYATKIRTEWQQTLNDICAEKAEKVSCPGSLKLGAYLILLEHRIEELERR